MLSPAFPDAFPTSAEIAATLRRELRAHNSRVVVFTIGTAIGAAVLWVAFYAVAYWLTLLFLSSVMGLSSAMPEHFREVFYAVVAGLMIVALTDHLSDRLLNPDDRPKDEKSRSEIAMDIILAIPRITISIWSTLSAWLRLDDQEIAESTHLVEQLGEHRRLRLQSVPLEIPDEKRREKILFALQLLELIDIRREDREMWVVLNPLRPAALRIEGQPKID